MDLLQYSNFLKVNSKTTTFTTCSILSTREKTNLLYSSCNLYTKLTAIKSMQSQPNSKGTKNSKSAWILNLQQVAVFQVLWKTYKT